ncbi:hypothetical protein [Micromonospora tarensis]|uniref:Uncharacterized protein n=1 Tax=Micromonospora tarensis TaxID=2806100 RepID=A0ABS1YQP3_9ACTN|nr:hypothetical protein [Micromonospora tarensis]MBM0279744.1 hypothetical protein [Micromonospora tarensis]
MSETGQPGAATPGEHGDEAGQHDDPSRPGGGWAPPASGWPRAADRDDARDEVPRWQPEPTSGWRTSSKRHGDLPSPLVGRSGDQEPPARVNGQHANGAHHPDTANGAYHPDTANGAYHPDTANGVRHPDTANGAQQPGTANGVGQPGLEPPTGQPTPVSAPPGVPAEGRSGAVSDRLVVPAQRPAPQVEQGADEPDPGRAAQSTVDPAAAHRSRWAEPGLPTSAPPAVQVPPVGAAASGFEVPPGFHAPTSERLAADDSSTASRQWQDPLPPEQLAAAASGPAGPPDEAEPARAADSSRPGERPRASEAHRAGASAAGESDWSEPSWNRSSWGSGWAPPWSRQADEPAGPAARDESAPGWVAEPHQPYEPVRAESPRPYEPVRVDPPRGYDPAEASPAPRLRRVGPPSRPVHCRKSGRPGLVVRRR